MEVQHQQEAALHKKLYRTVEKMMARIDNSGGDEKMLEDIRKNRPERAHLYEGLRIILPTETIEDKYTLPGLDMIHLPGHTDCSSIVYVPEDRICFAGDLMFAKRFPWAGDPTANPDHWIQAFKTLLEMDVETYVPGHGPLCGKDEFEKHLAWFQAARNKMMELIASGASEEEAINKAHYPEFHEDIGDRFRRSMRHWYKFYSM